MPSNWLYIDTNFPAFTQRESADEKIETMQDYLFMLVEQLRYSLRNLDLRNMNGRALDGFLQSINEPIYAQIEDSEGRINELGLTAEGLSARLTNAEGNITQLAATAQGLVAAVQDAEGKITVLALTVDGLTVTDEGGTTLIKGSSIETSTLYVDAAHITGSLVIGQLPGSVAQKGDIPTLTSQLTNNSEFQDASGVVSIVNGTVTADYIYALGVEASVIRGNSVGLKDGNGNTVGAMALSYTSTGMGIAFLTNQGGIQLQPAGNVFLKSGSGAFITLDSSISLGGGPLLLSDSYMFGPTPPAHAPYGTMFIIT